MLLFQDDVSIISFTPKEQLESRTVRIFSPVKSAMQSGTFGTHKWQIQFDTRDRWENPMMGWTATYVCSSLCTTTDIPWIYEILKLSDTASHYRPVYVVWCHIKNVSTSLNRLLTFWITVLCFLMMCKTSYYRCFVIWMMTNYTTGTLHGAFQTRIYEMAYSIKSEAVILFQYEIMSMQQCSFTHIYL